MEPTSNNKPLWESSDECLHLVNQIISALVCFCIGRVWDKERDIWGEKHTFLNVFLRRLLWYFFWHIKGDVCHFCASSGYKRNCNLFVWAKDVYYVLKELSIAFTFISMVVAQLVQHLLEITCLAAIFVNGHSVKHITHKPVLASKWQAQRETLARHQYNLLS